MRYILPGLFAFSVFLLVALASGASAHMGGGQERTIMERMMGSEALEVMEEMEEGMMGGERHERMEALTGKLLAGIITPDEQSEMAAMMRDERAGPAAMTMMMRMVGSRSMQRAGLFGGIGSWGMMGSASGGGPWIMRVTILLIWILLGLAIVALWRHITRGR